MGESSSLCAIIIQQWLSSGRGPGVETFRGKNAPSGSPIGGVGVQEKPQWRWLRYMPSRDGSRRTPSSYDRTNRLVSSTDDHTVRMVYGTFDKIKYLDGGSLE